MPVDKKLGPTRRIKRRRDFLRIQSSGKKFRSQHFLLSICPRKPDLEAANPAIKPEVNTARIGITITTKVNKRAARRNRLRRRIREFFRRTRPYMIQAVDLVVICMNDSSDLNYLKIKKELGFLFRKAKLL